MEILLTSAIFGCAMTGLALGVLLSNRKLAGSCGGMSAIDAQYHGGEASCGACVKQQADLCPTDDALVRVAQVGHPNPVHHR